MAAIKYINSAGKEMDLSSYPIRIRQKSAGLYAYEWDVDATDLGNGSRINAFERKAKTYAMTIDFSGTRSDRAKLLQEFFELTDYDVVQKSPGKLYVGNQFIEGYVIASDAVWYENRYRTIGKECSLYVPYPFWMEEQHFSFDAQKKDADVGEYLNFPFNYPFNFTAGTLGIATLINSHYVSSHFELSIYGPCVNPGIAIGGHTYQVNTTLASGEYLLINSYKNTVYRIKTTGERVNEYNNREKSSSLFEKIAPGAQDVVWSGSFGFELCLRLERSELKWN